MIYLFHGDDVEKVRAKAFEWVAKARAKEPNLVYIRLSREEITDAALEDVAAAGGLFVRRLLALLDDPFSNVKDFVNPSSDEGPTMSEHGRTLEEHLDMLATSDNVIIILAPKLSAARVKKLVAKAEKTYEFNERARLPVGRGFNAALVNALGARDGKRLWLEVIRALSSGDAPEMLHGLLHWKARDLMEKGSRAWAPREARRLSLSLISLLQDSRRRGLDLSRSLERFALSI